MKNESKDTAIAIIPARYESLRLPGKPLTKIAGKSLIQRTWENTEKCGLFSQVIVATDDERIRDHVESFGGKARMTSPDCPTGTDRIIEVLNADQALQESACIVNVQGDEPCLETSVMLAVISALSTDDEAVCSTACVPIESQEELLDPHWVKCVIDQENSALYFSRGLIPHGKEGAIQPKVPYYHHLGIYAYRPDFLLKWAKLPPTPLQQAEDLEQLKILEHGYKIHVAVVKSSSFGIDTQEDINRIEKRL